jgi:hypothetical protein
MVNFTAGALRQFCFFRKCCGRAEPRDREPDRALRRDTLWVATGTRDAGRGVKTDLRRRQVASAGLGQRLANSWRDKHYPHQKLDAASLVYTKAPQIIRAFGEGVVIRSKRGSGPAMHLRTKWSSPAPGPRSRVGEPSSHCCCSVPV